MRKFLWVMAAGILVLALAAPAMALDFKYGGEFRVRFYTGIAAPTTPPPGSNCNGQPCGASSTPFTSSPGSDQRGAQLRVRPLFSVSDDNNNIQAVLRLEIGDIEFGNGGGAQGVTNGGFTAVPGTSGQSGANFSTGSARVGNGSGGSLGSDGVNVETKWAYIDAAFPFGVPLRVRAGLQPWFLPKGMIVDDDVIGVRAYGSVKPFTYEVAWYRVSTVAAAATVPVPPGASGQATAPAQNTFDNNYDFYQARVDWALAEWLNPGIYGIWARNAATGNTVGGGLDLDSFYIGFTAAGKVSTITYDFDFVYGSAEGSPSGTYCFTPAGVLSATGCTPGTTQVDVTGWAADAGVHVPIGPVVLNLVGSIASGDKRDGGDSEAFPVISPSWNGPGGLFHLIGSGGIHDPLEFTQDGPTNLWTVGLTADYRPVKQLLITGGAAYAGFYTNGGNCATVVFPNTPCYGPSYSKLAGKSTLGTEFFLWSNWDVWTGFKVQGLAGFLVPPAGATAQKYILQLLYSF